MKFLIFLMAIVAACSSAGPRGDIDIDQESLTSIDRLLLQDCRQGLRRQQNGPYGMFVFCDGVLGTHVAFAWIGAMDAEPSGVWRQESRFWEPLPWSQNVVSAYWDPNVHYLYISRGTGKSALNRSIEAGRSAVEMGGLYAVHLVTRTVKKLYPLDGKAYPQGATMVRILSVDLKTRQLEATFSAEDASPVGAPFRVRMLDP